MTTKRKTAGKTAISTDNSTRNEHKAKSRKRPLMNLRFNCEGEVILDPVRVPLEMSNGSGYAIQLSPFTYWRKGQDEDIDATWLSFNDDETHSLNHTNIFDSVEQAIEHARKKGLWNPQRHDDGKLYPRIVKMSQYARIEKVFTTKKNA